MAVPDLKDALERLQAKDVDAAIASLTAKVEELPAHLTAHVLLARAYETKREWARALSCWENVHFLMPNSPVAREGKQRVLQQMDEADQEDERTDTSARPPDAPADASSETGVEAAEQGDGHSGADAPPPPDASGPSNLDELRRQTDQEARRHRRQTGAHEESEPGSSQGQDAAGKEHLGDPLEEYEDTGDGDLDRLIEELESARIEPDPNVDEVEPPDLSSDVDDLVSETLARIHEAQDQYRDAAQIYVKLASQEPEKARSYLERAAEMREKAEEKAQADN